MRITWLAIVALVGALMVTGAFAQTYLCEVTSEEDGSWNQTCVPLSPTETWSPTSTSTPTAQPSATATPTATIAPSSTPTRTATSTSSPSAVAAAPPVGLIVGPGLGEYGSITAAVNASAANGTIRIKAGTYNETVTLSKKLTLVPFGNGQAWIDGGCTRSNAVVVNHANASGSLIQGLGIRNTVDAAVLISGLTTRDVQIDGNAIQNFDCRNQGPELRAGVASNYGGSGIRITNNDIRRRTSGSLTDGKSDCIWFKSNTANPSGGGHYIAGNVLVGCWDGLGGETEGDQRGGLDRNSVVENNTILDCEDDGIQVEGGNLNSIVRNNVIRRCALGIANAPNKTGPLLIEGNDIREGRQGAFGNLACFKVGAGGTGVTYYTNNRCVLPGVSGGWSQTNSGMNRIIASGNQINVGYYVVEFTSSPASGTTFNNDCLYTTDLNRWVKWGGTLYYSLTHWQSIGQELQGESRADCGG